MDTDRNIYRRWIRDDRLVGFHVCVAQTDLLIRAQNDLADAAEKAVRACRTQIEEYIAAHPAFATSLEPLDTPDAPPVVARMADAARAAGVGPMAAVAGATAEFVGEALREFSSEVIVENGGDIYLATAHELRVGLFAGESPFTGKLGLLIAPEQTPLGICTSSGTVGHSLSFGRADAVTVLSRSAADADAYATAFANLVKEPGDIDSVLARGEAAPEVLGLLIVIGSKLGTWGAVTLTN